MGREGGQARTTLEVTAVREFSRHDASLPVGVGFVIRVLGWHEKALGAEAYLEEPGFGVGGATSRALRRDASGPLAPWLPIRP